MRIQCFNVFAYTVTTLNGLQSEKICLRGTYETVIYKDIFKENKVRQKVVRTFSETANICNISLLSELELRLHVGNKQHKEIKT